MSEQYVRRITIDLEAGTPTDRADPIIAAIVEKLERCWSVTTAGPIFDASGAHIANAKVEMLPLNLQLASERP